MSNVLLFNPNSVEHDRYVCQRIANMITKLSFTHEQFACEKIQPMHVEALDFERLDGIIVHFSPIKNRISIAENGIEARCGTNSRYYDSKKAIHFTYGIEGLLANVEIMLRLSLINLYSPSNSQHDIPTKGLSDEDYNQINTWMTEWMDYITSGAYRYDTKKLSRVYQFVKDELARCDLYTLYLIPDADFYFNEISEEKLLLSEGDDYTDEIYGVGTLTNLKVTTVDSRDMSTPLGEDYTIGTNDIRRYVGPNGDNAYCLIRYFYQRYLDKCKSEGYKPTEFALLADFIDKT